MLNSPRLFEVDPKDLLPVVGMMNRKITQNRNPRQALVDNLESITEADHVQHATSFVYCHSEGLKKCCVCTPVENSRLLSLVSRTTKSPIADS